MLKFTGPHLEIPLPQIQMIQSEQISTSHSNKSNENVSKYDQDSTVNKNDLNIKSKEDQYEPNNGYMYTVQTNPQQKPDIRLTRFWSDGSESSVLLLHSGTENDNDSQQKSFSSPLTYLGKDDTTETTEFLEQTEDNRRNPAIIREKRCSKKGFLSSLNYCGNIVVKTLLWGSSVVLIGGIIWYSVELRSNGTDPHLVAWFSAGAFVLTSFPISMYGITLHLSHYYCPEVQVYVIRILWMVPIYSIESWLCLRYLKYAIFIETLRDCYESYVLYCFFQYLIAVLGGRNALISLLKTKSPTRGVHFWGVQCFVKPWIMGAPIATKDEHQRRLWTSPFFTHCEFGILQYVLCKVFTSLATLIMELFNVYKEGQFSWTAGYLYCSIINNFSQCWALYCLVIFYKSTKNELSPIRPIGKFLSVKMLVFFTWWQALGISALFYADLIPAYEHEEKMWSPEEVSKAIQDYLICIEMFLFAIVHLLVFPYTDYIGGRRVYNANLSSPRIEFASSVSRPMTTRDKRNNLRNVNRVGELGGASHFHSKELSNKSTETSVGRRIGMRSASEDSTTSQQPDNRPGFLKALWQSTVPDDLMNQSLGIINGDFKVANNTLFSHSRTADGVGIFTKQANQVLQRQTLKGGSGAGSSNRDRSFTSEV